MSPGSYRRKRRLGCLFSLLILATVLYFGVDLGNIYFKYWQFREEIKAQAGFARDLDNSAIRRRLNRKIENLGLPAGARSNLSIRRTNRPKEIVIRTAYEVEYILPFTTLSDTLNIEIRSLF